ncbi:MULTISPECIES: hypothetical protein [unclassified Bradyrhizobium]|uniref:hypothetical protein n=1 Tax=unclassified Bradyrhizobium TaxID=2631580 RepID=UPI0028E2BB41|nr:MULTISPECIES: hypothetical protein [unclassified Bradyrhizobium]
MKQPENKQIIAVFVGHGLAIFLAVILIAFSVHALTALQQISRNASVYQEERGKVAGVFAAARDVTEYVCSAISRLADPKRWRL